MATITALVMLLAGWTGREEARYGPHTADELRSFRDTLQGLEVQFGPYFVTAGRCAGCHGFDSLGLAMVDLDGVSVNVADDWRSTMMANSSRDPFFRAKIEHESLVNPAHAEALQNKCLGCHAPLGMHQEKMLGNPAFTLAMLDTSVMGHDGVSCLACHMQNPDSAGHHFSGELTFDSAQVYGPYPDSTITAAIMEFFVRFRPSFGEHIIDGRVCAGCHTLITETVDLEGNYTGGHFVEQATWQEWKNSDYPAQDRNCRGCHMPRIDDPVILASEYAFLDGHSPFGKHELVGGNTFMLRMMRDRIDELRIPATVTQFDSTIARTERMLRGSVQLDVVAVDRTPDTLFVDVALLNQAGHKFPSGYPSRRSFVQLIAIDEQGDTLFRNGLWDETWEVVGHDLPYEPHHDVITNADQVQIYELVMGDVNNDVTTVLERAAAPLKDNRLVPSGFSTTHPSYDTTLIAGVPAGDIDFNHHLGEEGNGGDVVHYHVPMDGYTGQVRVHARIFYQPVPPQWNAEMFSFHSDAIDSFRDMYALQDGTPELVAADSLLDIPSSIGIRDRHAYGAYPNPTVDGLLRITGERIEQVRVMDPTGRMIDIPLERRMNEWMLRLPATAGTYLIAVKDRNGERLLRVVRLSR